MNLNKILKTASREIQANRPEILAGIGIVGTAVTAYLAARGGKKAQRELDRLPEMVCTRKDRLVIEAQVTWKCYVPAALSGAATIAAIAASAHTARRRTAAAFAAYSLSEKAFSEYKAAVKEEIGESKEERVREKIAQERVNNNPPEAVFMSDAGDTLCCELWTMRYFRSDQETLRKAVNDANRIAMTDGYVQLDEFYDLIGLDATTPSNKFGWAFEDGPIDLKITCVMGPKGEPTLAFDYTPQPKPF